MSKLQGAYYIRPDWMHNSRTDGHKGPPQGGPLWPCLRGRELQLGIGLRMAAILGPLGPLGP